MTVGILFALAGVVVSLVAMLDARNARKQRDRARQEIERLKSRCLVFVTHEGMAQNMTWDEFFNAHRRSSHFMQLNVGQVGKLSERDVRWLQHNFMGKEPTQRAWASLKLLREAEKLQELYRSAQTLSAEELRIEVKALAMEDVMNHPEPARQRCHAPYRCY